MFRWYHDSALTIVYLSDVAGFAHQDLVKSKWFKRGWCGSTIRRGHRVSEGKSTTISSSHSGWICWRRRQASRSWGCRSSHRARKIRDKGSPGIIWVDHKGGGPRVLSLWDLTSRCSPRTGRAIRQFGGCFWSLSGRRWTQVSLTGLENTSSGLPSSP